MKHCFKRLSAIGLAALAVNTPASAAIVGTPLYSLAPPPGFFYGPPTFATGGQVIAPGTDQFARRRALLWNAGDPSGVSTGISLHPTGYAETSVYGTDGTQQVGIGTINSSTSAQRALLWSGSAASAINLTPTGYDAAGAYAVRGNRQGGFVLPAGTSATHAAVWSGTAGSVVDLHPASGYSSSDVRGVGETSAVGSAYAATPGGNRRPALWTQSTAASFVDLTPANFTQGVALAANGSQQVGAVEELAGATLYVGHAALWTGSAASFVDLHVPAYRGTVAAGTDGHYQVGYGFEAQSTLTSPRALMWSGTAASLINLHALLPSTFSESAATAIIGDTAYGYAFRSGVGYYAVAWTGIPEPASAGVLAAGALMLRRRRVRR